MKVLRYLLIALGLMALTALALSGSACTFVKKVIVKDKLNQGVLAYNRGQTEKAAQLFKDTTEMIPDSPTVWLHYGAVLRKEYMAMSGDERKKKADDALAAYHKALDFSKNDCKLKDNAMGYIATIYDDLGDENKHREWLLKRVEASDCAADKTTKAITYHSIAVKYWTCAYNQSTRYADRTRAADPYHVRNFYYEPDKQKFDDCLEKGFEYIEKTLAVDPDYADALSYKSLLFRERQKSTKNEAERKKYEQEAEAIAKRAMELMKQQKDKAEKSPQG